MIKQILLFICLLASSSAAISGNNYEIDKWSCAQVDENISSVKENMRVKYNEKKGERLRAQLRDLRKQQRDCKKNRFSTSA